MKMPIGELQDYLQKETGHPIVPILMRGQPELGVQVLRCEAGLLATVPHGTNPDEVAAAIRAQLLGSGALKDYREVFPEDPGAEDFSLEA